MLCMPEYLMEKAVNLAQVSSNSPQSEDNGSIICWSSKDEEQLGEMISSAHIFMAASHTLFSMHTEARRQRQHDLHYVNCTREKKLA